MRLSLSFRNFEKQEWNAKVDSLYQPVRTLYSRITLRLTVPAKNGWALTASAPRCAGLAPLTKIRHRAAELEQAISNTPTCFVKKYEQISRRRTLNWRR